MARYVEDAATAVLGMARTMLASGLVSGTAGNISARLEDGNVCITPSSVEYADMILEDLVVVDPLGAVVSGRRAPSSEMVLHLAVLRAYQDVASVIHSHPVHATMFAVAHRSIPACIDEFSVYVGGDVRCTDYAVSGSEALGVACVDALVDRGAALIANHGMVSAGPTPARALHITALVERSARIIWGAHLLGEVHHLPEEADRSFAGVYRYMRSS